MAKMSAENSHCTAIYKSIVDKANQAFPCISLNTSDPQHKVHLQEVMVF
jgi:hypothetical protein